MNARLVSRAEVASSPETHRGLTFPLGRWAPATGEAYEIAPGVFWIRMPLPFSLAFINLWVLDDGDSWTVVDTGLSTAETRQAWEALLAGPFASKPVGQVIVTHFHPDHIGMAGWLVDRFNARLAMTRTEFLMARVQWLETLKEPPEDVIAFYQRFGWKPSWLKALRKAGWEMFAQAVVRLPSGFFRIKDGDRLVIGSRTWRIVTGGGHTGEHACLICDEAGLLISGDQLLPRITSNVSVFASEPEADPLTDWLASMDGFLHMDPGLLVLPAHNEPFVGVRERAGWIIADHQDKLERLMAFLVEPRTAVACFEVLFGRPISGFETAMATGEAIAHLNYLLRNQRVVRMDQDGVAHYVTVEGDGREE